MAPVLLVKKDAIPTATALELTRLRPERIVILGGSAAIGPEVAAAAGNYTTGAVTRIGGANRFETAAMLSADHFPRDVSLVYLATGANYADALAAAPLGTPILLVQQDCVPLSTFTELARLSANDIVVLGGATAVSDRVRRLIACS